MVTICSICTGKLILVHKVPNSSRGNTVCVCEKCGIIQSIVSSEYNPKLDPHSLQFIGKRHVSASEGAMWGNIRHGKGLRLDAHQNTLKRVLNEVRPKKVFDDGANRGHFSRFVSNWSDSVQYRGCEPDPICFESYYNNNTPTIKNCYTEQFELTSNELDFIYSAHTLEHVESVSVHLNLIIKSLKMGGTLFLDLPNSQQINFEDQIFEEYFVEKHKTNFMINDIVSLLTTLGMEINFITSDPFNMTVVSQKTSKLTGDLNEFHTTAVIVERRISEVKNYFLKADSSKTAFLSICKNLNLFKQDNPVVFYGGGRLLLGFLSMGLSRDGVLRVIDNYLFDKIDSCGGLKLYQDQILAETEKNTPIILFARSSAPAIKENLFKQGFKTVKIYSEFM